MWNWADVGFREFLAVKKCQASTERYGMPNWHVSVLERGPPNDGDCAHPAGKRKLNRTAVFGLLKKSLRTAHTGRLADD